MSTLYNFLQIMQSFKQLKITQNNLKAYVQKTNTFPKCFINKVRCHQIMDQTLKNEKNYIAFCILNLQNNLIKYANKT